MKIYTIEYSKDVQDDLMGIKQYIKHNLHEPQIAEKIVDKIIEKINSIKFNPKIYPVIDEDGIRELKIRKLIVGNYIVFYIIEQDKIQITRILHKKRNWINLI